MASEQELEQVARDINVLASFLGTRDVPSLTPKALDERYGIAQADVMALFGAPSSPAGTSWRTPCAQVSHAPT